MPNKTSPRLCPVCCHSDVQSAGLMMADYFYECPVCKSRFTRLSVEGDAKAFHAPGEKFTDLPDDLQKAKPNIDKFFKDVFGLDIKKVQKRADIKLPGEDRRP